MTYIIREAVEDDARALAEGFCQFAAELKALADDVYFDYDEVSIDQAQATMRQYLQMTNGKVYVALDSSGQLAGMLIGVERECFLPLSSVKVIGYIEMAYVSKGCRKKGVAKLLEQQVCSYFKERGIKYVELNTMIGNSAAKGYWEGSGYETFRLQLRKKI